MRNAWKRVGRIDNLTGNRKNERRGTRRELWSSSGTYFSTFSALWALHCSKGIFQGSFCSWLRLLLAVWASAVFVIFCSIRELVLAA